MTKDRFFRLRRTTVALKKIGILNCDLQVPLDFGIPLPCNFQMKRFMIYEKVKMKSLYDFYFASSSQPYPSSGLLEHQYCKPGAGAQEGGSRGSPGFFAKLPFSFQA